MVVSTEVDKIYCPESFKSGTSKVFLWGRKETNDLISCRPEDTLFSTG